MEEKFDVIVDNGNVLDMNDKILKEGMEICYKECFTEKRNFRKIIAKAVNLGMKYQEAKIKSGIDIVFDELHK